MFLFCTRKDAITDPRPTQHSMSSSSPFTPKILWSSRKKRASWARQRRTKPEHNSGVQRRSKLFASAVITAARLNRGLCAISTCGEYMGWAGRGSDTPSKSLYEQHSDYRALSHNHDCTAFPQHELSTSDETVQCSSCHHT